MNRASFKRTADIALRFNVIKKPATSAAYRTDLAQAALKVLARRNVDLNGLNWKKSVVVVTAGGK
jgi:hypothetical protein